MKANEGDFVIYNVAAHYSGALACVSKVESDKDGTCLRRLDGKNASVLLYPRAVHFVIPKCLSPVNLRKKYSFRPGEAISSNILTENEASELIEHVQTRACIIIQRRVKKWLYNPDYGNIFIKLNHQWTCSSGINPLYSVNDFPMMHTLKIQE